MGHLLHLLAPNTKQTVVLDNGTVSKIWKCRYITNPQIVFKCRFMVYLAVWDSWVVEIQCGHSENIRLPEWSGTIESRNGIVRQQVDIKCSKCGYMDLWTLKFDVLLSHIMIIATRERGISSGYSPILHFLLNQCPIQENNSKDFKIWHFWSWVEAYVVTTV